MRLRDLKEHGLIYDSSDRCTYGINSYNIFLKNAFLDLDMTKSLSYLGYECLSKPLRALGGEALRLKDDVRNKTVFLINC